MGEGKPPEACHIPMLALDLLKTPTKLATHKLVIPDILKFIRILPSFIQTFKLHYTKFHPQSTKIHLPFTQFILHPTKFYLPTSVFLPTVLT